LNEIEVGFNPSAFKHGVSKNDIYNAIDEQTINVFHADTCRKAYLKLLDK
jgi:L-rhamnose isomerase